MFRRASAIVRSLLIATARVMINVTSSFSFASSRTLVSTATSGLFLAPFGIDTHVAATILESAVLRPPPPHLQKFRFEFGIVSRQYIRSLCHGRAGLVVNSEKLQA